MERRKFLGAVPFAVGGGLALSVESASAQSQSPSSYVSVTSFGAVGDGKTDDTAAIQSAIKACESSSFPGGSTLLFPDGIYLISSTLVSTGWLTIVGMSKISTVITSAANAAMLSAGALRCSNIQFIHTGNAGNIIGTSNDKSVIMDCSFSMSSSNTTSGVLFQGSNCDIRGCDFTTSNVYQFCVEIFANGSAVCINNAIRNNTFYGTGKGIWITAGVASTRSEGTSISDNKIVLTGGEHIRIDATLSTSIVNNVIDQSSEFGVHLAPSGLGVNTVVIADNYIATPNAATSGVGVGSTSGSGGISNIVMQGNTFEYCGYGIALDIQTDGLIISGNIFVGINQSSINVQNSQNVTIANNLLTGSNNLLLLADGSSGGPFIVAGNQLSPSGNVAITQSEPGKFSFDNNQGLKLSGWASGSSAPLSSGSSVNITVPHGLAYAPNVSKMLVSLTAGTGTLLNPAAIVAAVSATTVTVNVSWSDVITAGTINANVFCSI
jgi:polygalacturonase